jgi:hypothetical protein
VSDLGHDLVLDDERPLINFVFATWRVLYRRMVQASHATQAANVETRVARCSGIKRHTIIPLLRQRETRSVFAEARDDLKGIH